MRLINKSCWTQTQRRLPTPHSNANCLNTVRARTAPHVSAHFHQSPPSQGAFRVHHPPIQHSTPRLCTPGVNSTSLSNSVSIFPPTLLGGSSGHCIYQQSALALIYSMTVLLLCWHSAFSLTATTNPPLSRRNPASRTGERCSNTPL